MNYPEPVSCAQHGEDLIVWEYFNRKRDGFFVEVGANDPVALSQTHMLEQQGWRGLLIEPIPSCCARLAAARPNSTVCEMAATAPEKRGTATLHIAEADAWSYLEGVSDRDMSAKKIKVKAETLETVLDLHQAPQIDLLSIDVEGAEIDVLRGLDLKKRKPSLILIEDHLDDLKIYRYLRGQNYFLGRRSGCNNWWFPQGAAVPPFSLGEKLGMWNEVWLKKPRRKWFGRK